VIFWIDAQLPPQLAQWLSVRFGVEAVPLRALGMRDAADRVIFRAARDSGVVLVSKDVDFVDLIQVNGTPPQLLWVTCGNVSNRRLHEVFDKAFPQALLLLREGRPVIEIADA
jgi:predicted nuclease of predicted toxin-antitoxin system